MAGAASSSRERADAGALLLTIPTKLHPPRIPAGLIERPELFERLREGRERALTLVSAPAGYGKTTLLSQWAVEDSDRTPFAWVSLDERDSDPPRLWGHLIEALGTVHDRAGERSLRTVAAGPSAISDTALPLLVDELSDCPPAVLVLEDWHRVTSRAGDETVGSLVDRAPRQVQIVISTRSDPRFPIARLRAHGDLTEIRERDLRVSAEQAAVLFRTAGLALSGGDVQQLTERTEGWLAGLCLALIVLREQDNPRRFVREFSGDTRHVFDYLAGDVLGAVDPEVMDFMLRSSVLDTLSAAACDAVLERSDSASMLAEIERSNLFLVPLDASGVEHRYHHLFQSVLRRQLESTLRNALPGLHARASAWYETQGDVERAVEHGIASHDVSRASALVLLAAVPLLSAGRMTTVNNWFEELSWPEALADRQLAAMRALTARLSGHGRDEVERWLAVAESGPDFGPLPNGITSMSSCVAMVSSTYLSRGIDDAERSARLVLDREPVESPWRYAGLVPLGQALYLAGRPQEARAPLEQARALPGARGHISTPLGIAYLALVELADGDAEQAERLARDALGLAEELGHTSSFGAVNPHLALGCTLMHGPDIHGAIQHLERAVGLAGTDTPSYWHAHALLHLAEAHHRVGAAEQARQELASARAQLEQLPDVGALGTVSDGVAAVLHHRVRRDGFLGDELSEAERRVLALFAEGRSVSEVAHELWLSSNTVKTHRRSIYRKLGASSREQMLESARAAGLLGADVHPGE